jgi:hypothetical protein
MEQEVGPLLLTINTYTIFLQSLSNPLNIELVEEVESIPKVGDLWLFIATVSPSHRIRFFLVGINALFVVGHKVVKIEHFGVETKVLV